MAQRGGSNVLLPVGLAAAGGVGYYLYRAGGSPKVAENQAERKYSQAAASRCSESALY